MAPRNIEMIKIGLNGEQLPADATDHVAVLLPAHGLMFTRSPINSSEKSQTDLEQACKEVTCAGFNDWDMPEIHELELIVNRSRCSPAVNTDFFAGIPNDWLWSKTDCAWQEKDAAGRSASAWHVNAGNGNVNGGPRGNDGFAVAVRRVGQ